MRVAGRFISARTSWTARSQLSIVPRAQTTLLRGTTLLSAVATAAFFQPAFCETRHASSQPATRSPTSTSRLQDKVVLITGAGTGIGKAVALALAREGCQLVLSGRRPEILEEVKQSIQSQYGTKCIIVQTDVTNPQSVENLFAAVKAEYGRLDVLFITPGSSRLQPYSRTSHSKIGNELWTQISLECFCAPNKHSN